MEFILVSFGMVAVIVVVLVLLARAYPGSGADLVDWKPTRSYEDEIRLELEDVDQMLEAQNERRRRSGRPEISEDQIRGEVRAEERAMEERRERFAGEGGEPPAS